MAVYYKFKSAKDYFSVPIDGHFISIANLKQIIFKNKHLGTGTDYDLLVSNAQTNQEYEDEATLIPKNTSVLVHRVPGLPRKPIVVERKEMEETTTETDVQQINTGYSVPDSLVIRFLEEGELDEFGDDVYAIPEQSDDPAQYETDEEEFIDASASDCQRQFQSCRGRLETKTPPSGYICNRCKVLGHFIQHCPTNGYPDYDNTGNTITPVATVLRLNEAAFRKEIKVILSTNRSISNVPPDLKCQLCNQVMKDAVLTSKCCYKSFCDKCIRDHIISKLMCICGEKNALADDLLPNKTLRNTINNFMETNNRRAENARSMLPIQDTEAARPAELRFPSPTPSAGSKWEKISLTYNYNNVDVKETRDEAKHVPIASQKSLGKARSAELTDVLEATSELTTTKRPTFQSRPPVDSEEMHEDPSTSERGKKRKKTYSSTSDDLNWRGPQDGATENYMMHFTASASNPYWGGMQFGMNGFMNPYAGNMPYMGYGPGSFGFPFGVVLPGDHFNGQSYMMPVPPSRNPSEFAMSSNQSHRGKNREVFETQKTNWNRSKVERSVQRGGFKGRNLNRAARGMADVSPWKSRHRPILQASFNPNRRHQGPVQSNQPHQHNYQSRQNKMPRQGRLPRKIEPVWIGKRRNCHGPPLPKVKPIQHLSMPNDGGNKRKHLSQSDSDNWSEGYRDHLPSTSSPSHHHYRAVSSNRHHTEIYEAEEPAAMQRKSSNSDHDLSDDEERHSGKSGDGKCLSRGGGEEKCLSREGGNEERLSRDDGDEERLSREGCDKERLSQEDGDEERLSRKGNEECLSREGGDEERLSREGGDEERLSREGRDEEHLSQEGDDEERLSQQGDDEECLSREGGDEERYSQEGDDSKVLVAQKKAGEETQAETELVLPSLLSQVTDSEICYLPSSFLCLSKVK